jgi:hypothetical protein
LALIVVLSTCARPLRSTLGRSPNASELATFWVDPGPERDDTFFGPGGRAHAPAADAVYRLRERKHHGFSPKVDVKGPDGIQWSAKFGDEAQSEITASRIVWAVGYQQPPQYYMPHWRIEDEHGIHDMGPARFRPDLEHMEEKGDWSWYSNPFVESVQFRGLLVLMMILNSTDLKDDNNSIYKIREAGEGEREVEWYTVRDLGASLGQTGWARPRRNSIEFFEKEPFITGVEHGFVRFGFGGGRKWLVQRIRPTDVRWICQRLKRLSAAQWRNAFRAGGYDEATTVRYLAKINEKIAQGLALAEGGTR